MNFSKLTSRAMNAIKVGIATKLLLAAIALPACSADPQSEALTALAEQKLSENDASLLQDFLSERQFAVEMAGASSDMVGRAQILDIPFHGANGDSAHINVAMDDESATLGTTAFIMHNGDPVGFRVIDGEVREIELTKVSTPEPAQNALPSDLSAQDGYWCTTCCAPSCALIFWSGCGGNSSCAQTQCCHNFCSCGH